MTVRNLDHLNLNVQNLAQSIRFYRDLFGMEPVESGADSGYGEWAILRGGDAMLCLYERPEFQLRDNVRARELKHFALRLESADGLAAKIEALGLSLGYGGEVRYAHSRSWYVTDPTGYEIEIVVWDDDDVRFDAA